MVLFFNTITTRSPRFFFSFQANNFPNKVIVTDSDSMSDEDSDEQVSKMIDVPEPDSDYLIIEPVEPYERGTSIFK